MKFIFLLVLIASLTSCGKPSDNERKAVVQKMTSIYGTLKVVPGTAMQVMPIDTMYRVGDTVQLDNGYTYIVRRF